MIKTKSFDVKVDENGMISGYASTWTREPDSYGDVVVSTIVAKSEGRLDVEKYKM